MVKGQVMGRSGGTWGCYALVPPRNVFKEWVSFFWVHGEWIRARDKQIAWTAERFSDDLFVPRSDSFPMDPENKTLIPYIYNASINDPF